MEKENVGTQIIKNWGKSEAPECREVTNTAWWKTFQPRLKKELENYKGKKEPIYIMLSIKNEGLLGTVAKHATWLIFEEMPPPKTMSVLWSYKKSDGEIRLEWVIPDETSIEEICAMPESYDKKLVLDCIRYQKTKKIAINEKSLKRPKTKILLQDS